MDRMASHTHHPEVLRELFAALGNDIRDFGVFGEADSGGTTPSRA
jgi:hypothetical protein